MRPEQGREEKKIHDEKDRLTEENINDDEDERKQKKIRDGEYRGTGQQINDDEGRRIRHKR